MNKKVTMQTKGITQDKNGDWGIWRILPRLGRLFIKVGETGEEAAKRRTKELWSKSIEELKKEAGKPYKKETIIYSNGMTNVDYALWHEKLAEHKKGGYFDVTKDGRIYIPIGNKIIVTKGTYENPTVDKVMIFSNEDMMIKHLKSRRKAYGLFR